MGRMISVGVAGLAFFIAYRTAMKAPKWTGSESDFGYFTGVAIVAGIGVLCLFAPALWTAIKSLGRPGSKLGSEPEPPNNYRAGPVSIPEATSASVRHRPEVSNSHATPTSFAALPTVEVGQLVSVHAGGGAGFNTIVWSIATTVLFVAAGVLGAAAYQGYEKMKNTDKPIPDWFVAVPITPAVLGLLCGLMAIRSMRTLPTVALYADGLGIEHAGEATYFRWDEVAEVNIPWNMRERRWTFELHDGRKSTFHGRLVDFDRFYMAFSTDFGIPDMIRHRIARIDAGETVSIGDFEVSQDAIKLGNKTVRWAEIEQAVFQMYPRRSETFFRVEVAGRLFTWQSGNLHRMKSNMLFREVVTRVAPSRIWPRK